MIDNFWLGVFVGFISTMASAFLMMVVISLYKMFQKEKNDRKLLEQIEYYKKVLAALKEKDTKQ